MELLSSARMATKRDGDKQEGREEAQMVWIPKRKQKLGQTQKVWPICSMSI